MTPMDSPVERAALMRKMAWVTRKNMYMSHSALDQMGLGQGQVPVLMELNRHGELSQRELAEHVHVTPATISVMLKRMERIGYVERLPTEGDARVTRVRLTDRGKEVHKKVEGVLDRSGSTMLGQLTDEECGVLNGILTKLARSKEGDFI